MLFDFYKFANWLNKNKKKTLIMGVINVTPDSFSDGGLYLNKNAALDHAKKLISEGADIIDIGGESSRPGSKPISIQEEIDRILPVIESLNDFNPSCIISIDTYKYEVAEKAISLGAKIINDISGLSFDNGMVDLVVKHKVPIVIMHMKGKPNNMQNNPHYNNLLNEITDFFKKQIRFAKTKGVQDKQIILDPGIGFGKSYDDNFKIIKNLNQLASLGYPILIGTSRKAFIGDILGNVSVQNRIFGTAATVSMCVRNGANIVRVHDVYQMKQVVTVTEKILN
tara:strand:- start:4011 stop:4856 length:846 start_codon:yes stop_codon:yes gene_type:complete